MMNRRHFLAGVGALLVARPASNSGLLVTSDQAARMRALATGDRAATLTALADKALNSGPWSVTTRRPSGINVAAGPHDYVSEGPYWWPDPKNPTGPYIRKDGERNPDRFMGNRSDLGNMCSAVLSLGMGAFFLKKAGCADHAARILSVWFLDPKTRMTPNLEFGQMVRGLNSGRGTGIIDTVSLIHAAQGISLLELAGALDQSLISGLRQWYADYLKWMAASEKGLDEKVSGNNHSTWWTAQAAAYATFVGDSSIRPMLWNHYRTFLVPKEIEPDGSCPRELARTQSLSYSSMNLDAFAVVCRLAEMDGVDLWRFHTPAGIGVDRAFDYIIPFVLDPAAWKRQQITPFVQDSYVFPGLAGLGLHSEKLLSAYQRLPRAKSPWVQFIDLCVQAAA